MKTKNRFSVDQIQQLEIGKNGNVIPMFRDLSQDSTLKGSLLSILYPGIKVASVNVPVEPLSELEESRVRNAMGNLTWKGVRYKLVGASGSAKEGKFYFVDEQHHAKIADRFQNWPQAAIVYFGILVSNCRVVIEEADLRVLVVTDGNLGTNDCRAWLRRSVFEKLSLAEGAFYQFRVAFQNTQGKGSFKVMGDDVADILDADIVLPESCIKPGLKIRAMLYQLFGTGRRFRGQVVLGVRDVSRHVSRQLEFEPSYTVTQHAPGESIINEILPQTLDRITRVSAAVGEGRYEELLELIGHNPEKLQSGEVGPEEEVDTVEGLLLADKSGHIVKNPWVNAQLDQLLARWTFKACSGGVFLLPAFALADDGYLTAVDGKLYHGSDWIPRRHSISPIKSKRGLCVRHPVRMFQDLLPTENLSSPELVSLLCQELEGKGCPNPESLAGQIANTQIQLTGTYVLHSQWAKECGGDFDFDLVGVIEEDRFPLWVAARFDCKKNFALAKTKASKAKHPWWNIVHVARKAVGNQIGSITDLITSCLAEDRPDLAEELVVELQNALDNLKHGVEPDQKKIAAIRQQVTHAPWLRFKRERRVSDLPEHLDVKTTDRIGILWNHVRPHFDELLTQTAPLEAFIGLIDGETVTEKMIEDCHYVHSAYGFVVAEIAQRQTELKKQRDEAVKLYDSVRNDPDKEVKKKARLARNAAQAAYYYDQERAKDGRKAITNFVKIWAQNKTQNRMAWAQALNAIVCRGKGTGSLIWLAFPQELVSRLAALTGGRDVRLYTPKIVEGFVRKDEHGRAFLVEAIDGGLKETFLFTNRNGKVSLDDTIIPEEAKELADSKSSEQPSQEALPAAEDEGLGHDPAEEVEFEPEFVAESVDSDVPF
jgi:hypothetical protein